VKNFEDLRKKVFKIVKVGTSVWP